MRMSLVHNPQSGRNRRDPLDPERLARDVPTLDLHLLGPDTDTAALACRLLDRHPDLLVVSGGDGTLQRLLTALLQAADGAPLPAVAILPRGTANMIAADLGLVRRPPRATTVARLLRDLDEGRRATIMEKRAVVAIQTGDARPEAGFFFATGAVCDAIDFWAERFQRRGLVGGVSQLLTFLALLAGIATKGPEAAGLRPFTGKLESDGHPPLAGSFLFAFATTLDRLLLGATPFWNGDGAALRVTAVERDAPHLLAHAWRVVRGKMRKPPPRYHSFGAGRVRLRGAERFVVDGEFRVVAPGAEIVVAAGRRLRFVRFVD